MANTISLRDLYGHVKELDRLVSNARISDKTPADLDFDSVRASCRSIMDMLGDPGAQDDTETKAHTEKRAEYQRAAKDTDPAASVGNKPPHAADARPRTEFDVSSLYTHEGERKPPQAADVREFDVSSLYTYGERHE